MQSHGCRRRPVQKQSLSRFRLLSVVPASITGTKGVAICLRKHFMTLCHRNLDAPTPALCPTRPEMGIVEMLRIFQEV